MNTNQPLLQSLTNLILIVVILGLGVQPSIGAEIDTDRYFAFPRATLVTESNGAKVTTELSRNFAIPTSPQSEPKFSSGHKFENSVTVQHEFLRKTEYGDVYLVVVVRPGSPDNPIPVLFRGTEQVVIATKDLTVRILPGVPPKK
ncbi:MAG: hypothetical protein K0Q55_671 [Verrucomicrobia bacterium]|jgi:hypothetical protein|nr:hypothetical protein [Verrucomicrobiota bacterium]